MPGEQITHECIANPGIIVIVYKTKEIITSAFFKATLSKYWSSFLCHHTLKS